MLVLISQLFIEVGAHIGPSGCVDHFGRSPEHDGVADTSASKETFFPLEIQMLSIFRRLMKNDKGATAIEYALIASLIAVAAVTVMKAVGTGVKNSLQAVSNNLT